MKPMKGAQGLVEKLLNRPDVQEAMVKSGTAKKGSPLYKKYMAAQKQKPKTQSDSGSRPALEPNLKRTV